MMEAFLYTCAFVIALMVVCSVIETLLINRAPYLYESEQSRLEELTDMDCDAMLAERDSYGGESGDSAEAA